MEDRQIIKLFLQRSGSAIAATAKKYGSRLLQLAGNILRDPRDAEEAVNDTYLALWNAIPPSLCVTRLCPLPPHAEQVSALVPFCAPLPPHSEHFCILLYEISFLTPKAASSKSTVT